MWAAQFFNFVHPRSHITSGGLGTMGFSLPAAMGASFGREDLPVISISGDGGFQMNAQELTTIVEHKLPVKIVVINNGFLGMVRQWQELFWRRRYSHVELSNPDFVKLAEAHGCPGIKVTKTSEVEDALRVALEREGPVLVECVVEKEDNVYPMIPAGQSVHEMIDTPEPVDDKETVHEPVTILEKGNNVQQRTKRPGRSKIPADAE
jgi:acetolactate synthase-1/2/3 large subunit